MLNFKEPGNVKLSALCIDKIWSAERYLYWCPKGDIFREKWKFDDEFASQDYIIEYIWPILTYSWGAVLVFKVRYK